MTIAVYRRLWCDGRDEDGHCGNWHGTAELNGETADQIRRSARVDGWTRRRRDGRLVDLCPEHLDDPQPHRLISTADQPPENQPPGAP